MWYLLFQNGTFHGAFWISPKLAHSAPYLPSYNPKLMELAKNFAENVPDNIGKNWMFYLWGHSFEFDGNNNWEVIENFAEYIGGREDIWYATNIEIYDYVMAYEQLQVSVDRSLVYNPTAIKLWFAEKGKTYCVAPDETLII